MRNSIFRKHILEAGSALRVLALIGVSVAGSSVAITPAVAQDYTAGAISGSVSDEAGAPVANATVTVTSLSQGFTRTATTTASGNFRFTGLPTGLYNIEVSQGGSVDFRAENVSVLAGQTASLPIVLAGGSDVIVVTGSAIQSAFEGTTTGLNVDLEELVKTVPLPRDLTSVVLLAPGTERGDSAFGNLASIGGSSVAENAYYVNGLNITNFDNYLGSANVPFDFYRSVEVKSGGYPAEFGRATGGIVNAVTKSGSNDWSGAVHLNWQPNFLRSPGKDLRRNSLGGEAITNERVDSADSYSAIVELGGPIIEDRLFAYGLVELRDVESTTINRAAGTATFRKDNDPFYGVKIDAYPIDNQHLEFTLFNTRRTVAISEGTYDEGQTGVTIGQFTPLRNANTGGLSYVGKYTGTFTDWLTLSGAYGVSKDRFDVDVIGSSLPLVQNNLGRPVQGVPNGGYFTDQRSTSLTSPYKTKREFYRADADVYFTALGDHHIRAGFDQEINTLVKTSVGTGGDYLFSNGLLNPAPYNANTGGAGVYYLIFPGNTPTGPGTVVDLLYFNSGGSFKSTNRAFYIQDEWSVTDRLTINLGLRRDDFNVDKADGSPFFKLDENYAPRVGFEYKLLEDMSARVFGYYGQYFLPVASNTAFRGAGAEIFFRERYVFNGFDANGIPLTNGGQITSAVDSRYGLACPFALSPNGAGGNTCRVTGDGTVPGSTQFVAANLKATKQSEFIIGYEQIVGDFTLGLSYIHRKLDRTAEDASIDRAAANYCVSEGFTRADCESIWNGFHQYVTYNVGGPLTVDLLGGGRTPANALDGRTVTFTADELGFPKATRKYDAVEFKFDRKWDGNWSLGGSYTWSEARGNTEGYVQSDFGQSDAGITQDFDVIGFTDNANGLLPNHRRHRMRMFGAVALGEFITMGANYSLSSPRPLSCFGFHPTDITGNLYGAASRYCNLEPVKRGEGLKTDWQSVLDISARYNIETQSGQTITFRADVFNLFNSQAVTERIETGDRDIRTQNAAGQPTSVTQNVDYGLASAYQSARQVRLGVDISF